MSCTCTCVGRSSIWLCLSPGGAEGTGRSEPRNAKPIGTITPQAPPPLGSTSLLDKSALYLGFTPIKTEHPLGHKCLLSTCLGWPLKTHTLTHVHETCVHTVGAYTTTHMGTLMCGHIHMYTYTHLHTREHIQPHPHTHVYAHTYMRAHTHHSYVPRSVGWCHGTAPSSKPGVSMCRSSEGVGCMAMLGYLIPSGQPSAPSHRSHPCQGAVFPPSLHILPHLIPVHSFPSFPFGIGLPRIPEGLV